MKRLLAVLALAAVIGGGWWVTRDPGHVPIFDADLRRLAETPLEARCAGSVYWSTRGDGDAKDAAHCRAENIAQMSDIPDVLAVPFAFCLGVADAGFPGDIQTACVDALAQYRLWPTYDGQLTDAWNRTAPYPGDVFAPAPTDDGSRTGEREGFTR